MQAFTKTDFSISAITGKYTGKVRDVYTINDKYLAMVATDRISAFDVVLPKGIPYKGQVLNLLAVEALEATRDIVNNWLISSPHPNLSFGHKAEPLMVEMVIRGHLTGHAWREYKEGKREICGVPMPDGMKEHDEFPEPIITPTTKAIEGHDEDISKEEIIKKGLVSKEDYEQLEDYTRKLFARGTELAAKRGLILVDTKYEFGKLDDEIILIDEVHTPDSSRYFYLEGYGERQAKGEGQKQLSKEFVRQWLIKKKYQGKKGQKMPVMPDSFVTEVSERYIELYEKFTGKKFQRKPLDEEEIIAGINQAIKDSWKNMSKEHVLRYLIRYFISHPVDLTIKDNWELNDKSADAKDEETEVVYASAASYTKELLFRLKLIPSMFIESANPFYHIGSKHNTTIKQLSEGAEFTYNGPARIAEGKITIPKIRVIEDDPEVAELQDKQSFMSNAALAGIKVPKESLRILFPES